MSRQLVPPTFSLPPDEYDVQYFNDLVRSLGQLVNQLQNPGELRGTKDYFDRATNQFRRIRNWWLV